MPALQFEVKKTQWAARPEEQMPQLQLHPFPLFGPFLSHKVKARAEEPVSLPSLHNQLGQATLMSVSKAGVW